MANSQEERRSSASGSRISREDVEHVAHLARLNVTEEEKDRFREQLNEILAAAERIQELDTDGVEPTAHAVPMQNVLRRDEPRPSMDRRRVLQNAPDPQGDYFRVPRIMEG